MAKPWMGLPQRSASKSAAALMTSPLNATISSPQANNDATATEGHYSPEEQVDSMSALCRSICL